MAAFLSLKATGIKNMYLIEILLPVFDNEGRKFPAERLKETKAELSERFGGVTAFTRAPAHGEVKEGDKVVHDDIVLQSHMTASIDRGWWADYRRSLERRFVQDEIIIRATQIEKL